MNPIVTAVSRNNDHTFTKPNLPSISLLAGLGVEGDAHLGAKVQHRSHIRKFGAEMPNLRQVHLIHEELFEELGRDGFDVKLVSLAKTSLPGGLNSSTCPPAHVCVLELPP